MELKSLALIVLVTASLHVQAEIALKPGRWLTTTKDSTNTLDVDAQSKKTMESARERMPANQRVEFDRMMAERRGSSDNSQEYECIKPEDVARSPQEYLAKNMRDTKNGQSCTFSNQHADVTKISYKFACSSNAAVGGISKGQMQMEFKGVSYSMELIGIVEGPTQPGNTGAKPLKSRVVSEGKWVSAKCQPHDTRVSFGAGGAEE